MKEGEKTIAHCAKHGDFETEWIKSFSSILSGKEELTTPCCPKCMDDYNEREERLNAEHEEQSRLESYKNSNIEPMYYNVTLDDFKVETPEQVKAKDTVQKLIDTRTGKIVMLGKNGTGKTHLAVCAVKALGGKILTMYEISTRIRATYSPKAKEDELEVTNELARLKMLVIDEIGRTKGSEAEENWLSYIIDKRNSRSLPLILISNKHTRKSCTENGCKDCLENYLSEDILSRLCVDGKVLNFTGEDYRKKR